MEVADTSVITKINSVCSQLLLDPPPPPPPICFAECLSVSWVLLHGEGAGERHGGVTGQDSGIAFERESWRALILECIWKMD